MESKEREKLQMLIDMVVEAIDNFDDCGKLLGEVTIHQVTMLRARQYLLVALSILLDEYKTLYSFDLYEE